MRTTREEALKTLGLGDNASADEIRNNYKRLALQWHPDKNHGNEEATQKFQDVSAAYKKLTKGDDSDLLDEEEIMTWADMMQLFRQMFAHSSYMHYGQFHFDDDDDDCYDYVYTDDDEYDDDDYYFSGDSDEDYLMVGAKNRFLSGRRRPITESEALRNAKELIEQEEAEKQKEERKRAKRKKKKEKRKQREKERKLQEEAEKEKKEAAEACEVVDEKAPTVSNTPKNRKEELRESSLNVHTQDKNIVEKEEKSSSNNADKTVNNKNHNRCSAVSNGFVPSKKERKKLVDPHSSEDDQIDTQSAFFAKAASKAPQVSSNHVGAATGASNKDTNDNNKPPKKDFSIAAKERPGERKREDKLEEKPPQMDSIVLRSREFAMEGNKQAEKGNYQFAVQMFTQAIDLDRSDFRFFGNRSYCCDRLGQFDLALKDANEAVSLAPDRPKGYFRKGRALSGLKRFEEAETAFLDVLKLDPKCEDAKFELSRVRVQILMEMGFDPAESREAIRIHDTVQAACEALLTGKVRAMSTEEDVYFSEDESDESVASNGSNYATMTTMVHSAAATRVDQTASNNNSLENTYSTVSFNKKAPAAGLASEQAQGQTKCPALWVGNVEPTRATEKNLTQLFGSCGKVVSVKILPAKHCAFVNYASVESAALALEQLQGVSFCDQYLLLRYPNNQPPPFATKPLQNTLSNGQRAPVQGKGILPTPASNGTVRSNAKNQVDAKLSGPVNGNECYYWRTYGCAFNDRCRYDHIPSSKGVDLNKVKVKAKYAK